MLETFIAILVYLPSTFIQQPHFLLYLGCASLVSFHLRNKLIGIRQIASMGTYLGLGLLEIYFRYDHQFEFQKTLFALLLQLLPSSLVAFVVLLLVQGALSETRRNPAVHPVQTNDPQADPALRGTEVAGSGPESSLHLAILATMLLAGVAMIALLAKEITPSPRERQARAAARAENYEFFSSWGKLNLSELKVEDCGITLAPTGLKVVTSYGFQVIPWEMCRELQVSSGRAQFLIWLENRRILLSPLEEPTGDEAWKAANYWQSALTRIQELGLMQPGQDSAAPVRLFRNEEVAPPKFAEKFPLPGGKYRGLPLETLRSDNWANGVTLVKEGVVVRDVCGIRSVAWKDVRKLLVETSPTVLRLVCGDDNQTLELLTSERATQRLSTRSRDELQKELISVLGLKLSQENPSDYIRSYVPSRGTLDPPNTRITLHAHLGKTR